MTLFDKSVDQRDSAGASTASAGKLLGSGSRLMIRCTRREQPRESPDDHVHVMADLFDFILHFRPEERLAHDLQRQPAHLLVDVEFFPVMPAIRRTAANNRR